MIAEVMQHDRLWRRLVGPFEEFGPFAGALYLVDRGLRALSPALGLYLYELMVQPISTKPLLPANFAKNLEFAEIGRGHPDIASMPARPEVKEARFEQGATCLGAYRKGVLIGYIWFCSPNYDEDEVRCTYELVEPDGSVFDFDLYVFPDYRMGIGFMAVWHGANAYLRERGVRHTFSRLTRFNVASRRSHAHLGWRRVATAIFVKLGGAQCMLSTTSPYVGMTWSSRIRLPLRADVLRSASPVAAAPKPPTRPDTTIPRRGTNP